ncbi:MAG: MutH/Sau3AI family endonuclease [Candidatus Izemoplasmatales bacterium]
MDRDRKFSQAELTEILDAAMGKSLGEVDVKHVFDRTLTNPKITGIAGDVVEQSVLGFDADNKAEPDIDVDSVLIELKTTGIRKSKTDASLFEAKEPMSITGVSPDTIVTETFYESRFWHKIRKMLLVYYEYASYQTVTARDYMNFFLRGYDFYEFSKYDRRILKSDWEMVQAFLRFLREQPGFEEIEYARLSHELRDRLMYIDTAPKWPNPPRFRLKRSVVTAIVQEHFRKHPIEVVEEIGSVLELDAKCRTLETQYAGKTLEELANLIDVPIRYDKNGKVVKSTSETVVVRMFGATKSTKINSLDAFDKAGIIGKTIILSNKGGRTEDMKLFTIDFDDWLNKDIGFEDSQIYDYFANHQFLCIKFKETIENDILKAKFVGFKRITFSEGFINTYAKWLWETVRTTIFEGKLKESVVVKKDGTTKINPVTKTTSTSINFPKSSDEMKLFIRGTGDNALIKPFKLCGIDMYFQQVWIKGLDIVKMLEEN